jgi:MFS transporter, AAHS family, benzoate transport protein
VSTTTNRAPRAQLQVLRTPRALVALCTAVMVFEGYDLFSYGAVVPSLLAHPQWHLTPAQAGHIGSAGVFGMLVGAIIVGLLVDGVGRKAMLVGSVTAFSLGMGLCSLAPNPDTLLLFRVIVGIGSGGFLPTAVAYVVECSPFDRRAFNLSIVGSGVAAGGVAAAVLGTRLIPAYGFRSMFLVGVLPLLFVPALARWLPESVSHLVARGRIQEAEAQIRRHRLPMLVDPLATQPASTDEAVCSTSFAASLGRLFSGRELSTTIVFWLGTAMCMMLIFGTNTWLPTIMLRAGYGITSSLAFLATLNAGVILGSLIASRVADRRGPRTTIVVGFVSCTVALLVLASKPSTPIAYLLIAVVGFGAGGTQNIVNAYIGTHYQPGLRGTGVGLALGFGRIGGVVGPTYAGWLIGRGADSAESFYAFAVPALLAATLFACGPRTAISTHSPESSTPTL